MQTHERMILKTQPDTPRPYGVSSRSTWYYHWRRRDKIKTSPSQNRREYIKNKVTAIQQRMVDSCDWKLQRKADRKAARLERRRSK